MTKKNDKIEYDILFLHPPCDFIKTRFPLSGVLSLGYEESGLFLYAPVGINALYHRLKSRGFNSGFLNVGSLFYKTIKQGKKFELGKVIAGFTAKGFGIDLHWAVHTAGVLDLAETIKRIYPDSFVFLGGLTATYFFEEILKEYPYIDAVVLAEADETIVPLAETLKKNSGDIYSHLGKVPNLAYRSGGNGPISVNPVQIPETWENVSFQNVEEDLSCAYISIKGCSLDCPYCGGSKSSYENFFYRCRPVALEPGQLIHEIETCEKKGLDSVALVGDIRMMGEDYVDSFFTLLSQKKFSINILGELFFPAEKGYLEKWKNATSRCLLTYKIESTDPAVLRRIGEGHFDNEPWELIKTCSSLEVPLELYFIFPLPGLNFDSIRSTMDFIEKAVDYPNISFVVEPLFYISPGSPIFENPEEWGYQVDFRTIKDFKKNLEKPHWSQSIGYHTQWLSKNEIIDMIFYVAERTNRIHFKQNPGYAPLYLLNTENMELNLKLIEQLREKGPIPEIDTDNYFKNNIKEVFPPYLLEDNLLQKTRLPKNDGIPYTLFPDLSNLLMRVFNVSPYQLFKYIKKLHGNSEMIPNEISLEEFKKVTGAPGKVKKEILHFAGTFDINIKTSFFDNLMDFEWANEMSTRVNINNVAGAGNPAKSDNAGDYSTVKLILNESAVIKTFNFDFGRVDWKNFSPDIPVNPSTTSYLYLLKKRTRRAITPFIQKLLMLCDGTRNIMEIIGSLKETEQENEILIAMKIGPLVSEAILLPYTSGPSK